MPQPTDPTQYQCRHIKPDGGRCGSPALRNEHFCYYHHNGRRSGPRQPQVNSVTARKASTFDLPSPADLSEHSGLGLALGLILHKIAHNEIDPRRAGLLLYGLQIASMNLKRSTTIKPVNLPCIEDLAFDSDHGFLAPQAELGQSEYDERSGRGKVQRLLEKIEREQQAKNQAEQEECERRRKVLEEEREQREAWKREDALRSASPGANPQSAMHSLSPETAYPGAQTLATLHARTETHAGSCRAALPRPHLNRTDCRRLRRLLYKGTRSAPHARQTPPKVQT